MIAQPSETPATPTIEQISANLQHLSPEQQQQVLDFAEFLAQKNPPQTPQKTIWEKIRERTAHIPPAEWENMPTDGSYQHDHYLYGTPKQES